MTLHESFLQELEQESASTRKMLERVPEEHFGWKPHEKSTTLGRLAIHVAEITNMITNGITASELDLATRVSNSSGVISSAALMQLFEENLDKAKQALKNTTDDVFTEKWKLRYGEKIYFELPKSAVVRTMGLNHLIHHRAQLGVYLRLLDVPVPGMYGPTADESM